MNVILTFSAVFLNLFIFCMPRRNNHYSSKLNCQIFATLVWVLISYFNFILVTKKYVIHTNLYYLSFKALNFLQKKINFFFFKFFFRYNSALEDTRSHHRRSNHHFIHHSSTSRTGTLTYFEFESNSGFESEFGLENQVPKYTN